MDLIHKFQTVYDQATHIDPKVSLVVSKSDNRNIVVYCAEHKEGNFEPKPVVGYWQTWEEVKDGKPQIDKLSTVEKKLAFGVKVISKQDSEVTFSINGYPKIPITFVHDTSCNNGINTRMEFAGQEYKLLGMYVHVNPDKPRSKPKGVSLMVQLPLPSDDGTTEWSPLFSIYLDAKVVID